MAVLDRFVNNPYPFFIAFSDETPASETENGHRDRWVLPRRCGTVIERIPSLAARASPE